MSEDFDSKLQDVEKRCDDSEESDQSDNEDDLDKQMGETEDGAEKYEFVVWKWLQIKISNARMFKVGMPRHTNAKTISQIW